MNIRELVQSAQQATHEAGIAVNEQDETKAARRLKALFDLIGGELDLFSETGLDTPEETSELEKLAGAKTAEQTEDKTAKETGSDGEGMPAAGGEKKAEPGPEAQPSDE